MSPLLSSNFKNFFLPVYFEISKKQYLRSILIFVLLVSPLTLVKDTYFPGASGIENRNILVWLGFFCGALWHAVNVLGAKTVLPPIESGEALYEKGRLALLRGNFELAALCFGWLEKAKPDDEDALYQLGKTYYEWKKIQEARACFKKYLGEGKTKWKKEIESLTLKENLL
jgi:tetratricopeptide (TPR) repeat protein